MDGIPINTADGYGDFQEIDPSAYRYVEVYKGANALRFGANALGGAINFVTPTGRDAEPVRRQRRHRQLRLPAPAGELGRRQRPVRLLRHRLVAGAGRLPRPQLGRVDPRQRQSRLPAHARMSRRASTSTPTTSMQRIPGSVTKSVALSSPKTAAATQRRQRLAAQHRHLAPRQQDGVRLAPTHHRRGRRLSGRPPPDASDLPVARLPLRGLRRLRAPHRRALSSAASRTV